MRYGDWDILLFPRDCKVPIREFKVACHVVHDTEFTHGHGSSGLPTVCCFVPGLAAGSPFQVSIHSWSAPNISQFTRSYSNFSTDVKFEARVLIDGRLAASTSIEQTTTWPQVIAHSFEISKSGALEGLRFPAFRQELLQQSYWSPADELGRIKIIISEGFPRDSLTMPTERVKNVVAFSFQHAPLDILEGSSIAWPNPSMWRHTPFTASMPVPAYPSDNCDSHAHSPRRHTGGVQDISSGHPIPIIPRSLDFEWLNGAGAGLANLSRFSHVNATFGRKARKSSTDTNMPDYGPSNHGSSSKGALDQPSIALSIRSDEDAIMSYLKVPTNTPTVTGLGGYDPDAVQCQFSSHHSETPMDLANSLTNSLLNQPMPIQVQAQGAPIPATEVRSRKENRPQHNDQPITTASISTHATDHAEMRKVSQQLYMPSVGSLPAGVAPQASPLTQVTRVPSLGEFGANITNLSAADSIITSSGGSASDKGTKRVRNFTPASARVIDEEDEPQRASPRLRPSPFAETTTDDDK